MLIYVFFLLIIGVFAFVIKNDKIGFLCILGLLFVSIFRAESVGYDTTSYIHEGFSQWASGMRTWEFIYYYLTTFMDRSGGYFLVTTFAIITFVGIILSCRRFKISYTSAFFFFILFEYFNLSMNIARQFAAIGVLLYAYTFLYEKGLKRYLFFLFVFIASGIHSSSIGFLIVYPLSFINIVRVRKEYLAATLIIFFLLIHFFLQEYYLQLAHSMALLDDLEVYARYFDQADNANLSLGGSIISFLILLLNIYVLFAIMKDNSDRGKLISILFFISIIIGMFFSGLYGNIGRLRHSINIINIIAYSSFFLTKGGHVDRLAKLAILVVFGYELFYSMLGPEGAYGTVPYKMHLHFL